MKNSKVASIDVYQRITNVILDRLNEGMIPWRQPFSNGYIRPRNAQSGRPYHGINEWLLCGFVRPYFLTYKQAQDLGGQVKKGTKGLPVVYWNRIYRDASGKKLDPADIKSLEGIKFTSFLRYFTVFNVEDIEGLTLVLPEAPKPNPNEAIERCEQVIAGMPNLPKINNGSSAYYAPAIDAVTIPEISKFTSSASYYAVLFHELIHATGHTSRLDRKDAFGNKFGSSKYAFEELVAELGAAFLCADCQIDCKPLEDNTVAYIQNWIEVLKNDSKFIINASSKARRAATYITQTAEPVQVE